MSQWFDSPTRPFVSSAALGEHLRVKFSSGKMALAGIADKELGTVKDAVFAADKDMAVILTSKQGTTLMVANAAMAVDADVFTAASGKVGPSASTAFYIGKVVASPASADGDIIEVLRQPHGDTPVV